MVDVFQFIAFDRYSATISGVPTVERRLSQLRGVFADSEAFEAMLAEEGDPLVYSVTSIEAGKGEGDLAYGIGRIMPGRVGQEYFLTRGHFHEWREAAEVYIGLSGVGVMLLENERTGMEYSVDLLPDTVVYVPGYTAHRTVNTGDTPLTYVGVYPAKAGHDYAALAAQNFSQVVVAVDERPVILKRQQFLANLAIRG
jgi:glucose-6-phosphate isomerase, archaeal